MNIDLTSPSPDPKALAALTGLFKTLVEQFGAEEVLAVVRDVTEIDIEGVRESEELFKSSTNN